MKGSIILVQNNEGNFISEMIKFFTKKFAKKHNIRTWTHSMIGVENIRNTEYVFSAEMTQCLMPLKKFKKDKIKFEIYKVVDYIKEDSLNELIDNFVNKYAGDGYGFFQLPWYIYRWIMELFNKDVRKQKNWFPSGDICSEMVFRFLTQRLSYSVKSEKVNATLKHLYEWTENTIHPVDLGYIIKQHPKVFIKTYSWNC